MALKLFNIKASYPSPNFWKGRWGYKVKAVVVHVTDSSFLSAHNTIMNRQSEKSYHYVINETGEVYQYVDLANSAWHAGAMREPSWTGIISGRNPNVYTLGVAISGRAIDPPSILQRVALKRVIAQLLVDCGLRANSENIVYHREIRSDKVCPGQWLNKDALVAGVQTLVEFLEYPVI